MLLTKNNSPSKDTQQLAGSNTTTELTQLTYELLSTENELDTFRRILSSSPHPIIITDETMHAIFVNPAWETFTQYSLAETERKIPRFLREGKKLKTAYPSILATLKKEGEFSSRDIVGQRKDGSLAYVHATFYPVVTAQKKLIYIGMIHDITDQRNLEKMMEFQSWIIANAAEGISLVSADDLRILYVNSKFESMFGCKSEEVVGNSMLDFIFASSKKMKKELISSILTTINKQGAHTFELENVTKDGSRFWSNTTINKISHPEYGQVFISVHEDMTSRKQLDELRKEFLSASAHELKTPISVLKLLAQTYIARLKKSRSYRMQREDMILLDQELNKLTRLIDDILDSSRLETGKWTMNFEIVDLSSLTEGVVKKMRLYTHKRKITFPRVSSVFVIADAQRIEQVLINLLSNAHKYSPQESSIEVSLTRTGKKVTVSVTDHGIGVPRNKQGLIFDRFYQVKSKAPVGFGLGLYISKEIITRHKGKLWVESEEGKGSTFSFSLPLRKELNKQKV